LAVSESWISVRLRRLVELRARRRCEYCLVHEDDTWLGFQVDHIISEKHGGRTVAGNLAYCCVFCNLYKGSDIATMSPGNRITRLFHPRQDRREDHFRFHGVRIIGLTPRGRATARLLRFNIPARLAERRATTAPS
jgi:hypothetical protein